MREILELSSLECGIMVGSVEEDSLQVHVSDNDQNKHQSSLPTTTNTNSHPKQCTLSFLSFLVRVITNWRTT